MQVMYILLLFLKDQGLLQIREGAFGQKPGSFEIHCIASLCPYFWCEGQSSQHSFSPSPSKALCVSMFKKWTPSHTHIQFVLQKHQCHMSLWASQPTPSVSSCEDNYLYLRSLFFLKWTFIPSQLSHQSRMTDSKEVQRKILCLYCT